LRRHSVIRFPVQYLLRQLLREAVRAAAAGDGNKIIAKFKI